MPASLVDSSQTSLAGSPSAHRFPWRHLTQVGNREPTTTESRPRRMQIAWRASLVVALSGLALALSACTGTGAVQPQLGRVAAALQLAQYDSCEDALEQLKRAAAEFVTPYGLGGEAVYGVPEAVADAGARLATGSAEAASGEAVAPDYSTTNTHEAGVDEPDLVKTDGRRIVTVLDGTLRVIEVESNELIGSLRFEDPGVWYPTQLLQEGDRVLVVMSPLSVAPAIWPPQPGRHVAEGSRLILVDVSGPPRIVSQLDVDGWFVDARQVDSSARIVVRSGPRLAWTYPSDPTKPGAEDAALAANQDVLARSTIEDWVPRYTLSTDGEPSDGSLVQCADVSHPRTYSGTSMLTVLTLDLGSALGVDDSIAVVGDGQTVYGTGTSLYIADDHRGMSMPIDMRALPAPGQEQTEIHLFDASGPGKPEYVASGAVDGWLLNQYSLSEHEGYLRVATTRSGSSTISGPAEGPTESQVAVLERQGGQLIEVGSVGGLGKGEQIYAVRFIGPVGYVVTFRQVDPLYTLDLSDPTSPRAVGELKIPGYSSYLHPAGDDRLIGVGQDADEQGVTRGAQVSLFDVGDPAAPARLDTFPMPGGWSEAEHDPHAFLYWPDEQLVVIPVWWDGGIWPEAAPNDAQQTLAYAGGAVVLRIDGDSLVEVGTLSHDGRGAEWDYYLADPTIRRSLVIGDTLWTLSGSGALASDLGDLDEQAWVPFTA